MERLGTRRKGFDLYLAGLPIFSRNFTRDSVISAMLVNDTKMLRDQLSFCELRQGIMKNAYNGEEPGKIFHEYPGVEFRGLSTEFNACDVTALFLVGHLFYLNKTKDSSLFEGQKASIGNAANYILSHLDSSGLFMENPGLAGAEKFALKVTYWKDSQIIDRENGEPLYPAVFTLAHCQNLAGLRAAASLLSSDRLKEKAEKMKNALDILYDQEKKIFYIAIDRLGPIKGASSDMLHMLYYLEPGDLSQEQLEGIVESSRVLQSQLGYRTLDPNLSGKIERDYHSRTIWPFEQAIIHSGAVKFSLQHPQEVSSRIVSFLDTDPEIFMFEENGVRKGGCDPQLWTIAAKKYFQAQALSG